MQASSFSSLSYNFSFPLCVSGITRRLTLSNELMDHDQRRRVMKRQRSAGRSFESSTGEIWRRDDEINKGDHAGSSGKDCCSGLLFAAKAA